MTPGGKSDDNNAPLDAPPTYDSSVASSSRQTAPVEKSRAPAASVPLPLSPPPSTVKSRVVQKSAWAQVGDDMGEFMASLGLGTARQRATTEVRKTVTGLIHDLVRDQSIDSVGILDSCSEVCAAYEMSMPSLLQRPYIEGHTPLYWAIVKRPADATETAASELPPLIRALLAYSAPLSAETVTDVRLACLQMCDQWLFQGLRCCPDFSALPYKDQLLLGVQVPPDTVAIEVPARHSAPFTVNFALAHFQKRMHVSHGVRLDFISHARMWAIEFFVAEGTEKGLQQGQWAACIALLDTSPPATVNALCTIKHQAPPAAESSGEPQEEPFSLQISGKLSVDGDPIRAALPDAFLYPQNPFLTADGTLRGKLAIQLKKG